MRLCNNITSKDVVVGSNPTGRAIYLEAPVTR